MGYIQIIKQKKMEKLTPEHLRVWWNFPFGRLKVRRWAVLWSVRWWDPLWCDCWTPWTFSSSSSEDCQLITNSHTGTYLTVYVHVCVCVRARIRERAMYYLAWCRRQFLHCADEKESQMMAALTHLRSHTSCPFSAWASLNHYFFFVASYSSYSRAL